MKVFPEPMTSLDPVPLLLKTLEVHFRVSFLKSGMLPCEFMLPGELMLPFEWQVLLTGKDGFVSVLPHQPRDVILLGIHKVHGDFLQEGHMGMSSYSVALPRAVRTSTLVQGLT